MKNYSEIGNHRCACCENRNVKIQDNPNYTVINCLKCDYINYISKSSKVDSSAYAESEKYTNYYVGQPPQLWYHKKTLDYLSGKNELIRILDFGCFDGFFTKVLVDSGFDALGCDWNANAIESGIDRFKLKDRLSTTPKGKFDCIIALEVIEHFPNPNIFMDTMLPHLNTGGTIILSCPNKNAIYRPKTDHPPHHFSRFSMSALKVLLERYEFLIEQHEYEMSSFQLVRNFIGDQMRSRPMLLQNNDSDDLKDDGLVRLKSLANKMAAPIGLCTLPFDRFFHKFGFAYLSQFLVAKKL